MREFKLKNQKISKFASLTSYTNAQLYSIKNETNFTWNVTKWMLLNIHNDHFPWS